MNLTPKYRVGDTYKGFTFTKVLPIEELQMVLYELEHLKTGAQVMHLASDDDENLFCISFQTLPSDSTGVAHILEHTVLCGSKRFPIKDPFFSMSRRSLNTFMNAMTGSDFTCYPAASQVEKDFYNLLLVYLDAVFHPELKELSFLQEGHRLEFEKPTDSSSPLLFKGIVFNEMKGSMSNPETRLWQEVMTCLTPDLTYAYNSGGEPKNIPTLTYEELKAFHQTYYHPSRSLFFFYGNFPLEKHLEFIEKEALKGIKKVSPLPSIPLQKRFTKPLRKEFCYPLSDEDLSGKSFAAFTWLTTEIKNQQDALALAVIDSILMETDASPLKYALLNSRLCTQADGYLDLEMSEMPYAIICRGTDPEKCDELEKVLFDTLKNLVAKKIDLKESEAALHQLEFSRLEITGDYGPFGLTLFMRSALARQHGCPSENALMIHAQFKTLREKIKNPSYLPNLIHTYFLDNPHFVRLIMKPSRTLEEEEAKEERQKLDALTRSLTDHEKTTLVKEAKKLKEFQEKKENKSLECLPKITLADVPKEVVTFSLHKEQYQQLSVFHHECFTNHIIYAHLAFDLPKVSLDELPYLQLLLILLPELGMQNRNYQENLNYINAYLGSFNSFFNLYPDIQNPNHLKPAFGFNGKALERHADKLFSLLTDACCAFKLNEHKRIKELILQIHTAQQNRLSRQALSYAIQLSLAPFSSSATINQACSGLNYVTFIRSIVKDLDAQLPLLMEKLQALSRRLFHLNTPHLILSCDRKQHELLSHRHYYGLGELPAKSMEPWQDLEKLPPKKSEGRTISSSVAFSAWGFKTDTALSSAAPALSVITHLLENTYLHQKIREQGGAYGAGAHYSALPGHFYFYAYRDPHIATTYKAFKNSVDFLLKDGFSMQELEEAKLGLIQDADAPISPGSRALVAYTQFREGRDQKVRQNFRDHLLATTQKDVKKALSSSLADKLDEAVAVTFAGEALLKKENKHLSPKLPILPT